MTHILHIQTALETAMVGISTNGILVAGRENAVQKEHGTFLQPAIRELTLDTGIKLSELSAISVVSGPGSYTGLRVGMSGAKGICFALQKPLMVINTLQWMAEAAKTDEDVSLCPMIDARRMEVFTALYAHTGDQIMPPQAMILDENSFDEVLNDQKICFFGGGTAKFKSIKNHPNAAFPVIEFGQKELATISWNLYQTGVFENLADVSPFYLKVFHSPTAKPDR